MHDIPDIVWKNLGLALLRHTLQEAGNGDGTAILAPAFSSIVHAAVSVMSADVDPVKLLDLATRNPPSLAPVRLTPAGLDLLETLRGEDACSTSR